MFSQAFTYNLCVLLAATHMVFAASQARGADERSSIDREYDQLIAAERAQRNSESITERLVSGSAALAIGLYGYHQDDRGLLTRLVYSSTQTAGVILLSDAILAANQPSLLLLTDRYLNRRGEMDLRRFKRAMVLVDRKRRIGERKQVAYTSLILAGIYGYNGYRETDRSLGLRDAFFFLSANFALVSAVSFYRLFAGEPAPETETATIELTPLPFPTLTMRF